MKRNIHSHTDAGFTLLELLVALILTGLLAIIISGALHLGSSASVRINILNEKIADNFASQRFIRRILSDIIARHVEDTGIAESFAPLLGGERQILFLAELPRYQTQGEPVWMLLQVDENTEAPPQLRLSTHEYDEEVPVDLDLLLTEMYQDMGTWRHLISVHEVDNITVNYLEIDDFGAARWVSEWRYQQILPAAIQIHFNRNNQAVKGWPDLIVSLQEDAYAIRQAR